MKNPKKWIVLITLLFFAGGCAYYNTFFNAKMNYEQARKKQKHSKSSQTLSGDIKKKYQAAIDKSWKLIKVYGDSNKYADDALLLIGKSYYHLQQYPKAERVLKQFLQKYLRSPLIPEAKLWLARTYIAEDQKEKALDILSTLLNQKLPKKLASKAFYILGELYYEQEDYELAIKNLEQCVRITDNDETKGDALFMIGEAYYNLQEYDNAIDAFMQLSKLDIPPIREYEAKAKVVEALIELKRYDEAETILKKMLRSQRFKKQFSLIETRLANLYEIQGKTDLARDYYYEIIQKYPRSEGASLCYYYLGQLYEFEYGNFDSAKVYYEKVKNMKSRPEVAEDSREKVRLLGEYLRIRNQLRKDRADIYKLEHGDSLLSDSMEVAGDSVAVDSTEQGALDQQNTFLANQNVGFEAKRSKEPFSQKTGLPGDSAMSKQDSLKLMNKKIKKKPKKVLVTRKPEEVRASFKKNSFGLAEYFLLKYQNYDSAATDYRRFLKEFDNDSVLTPKAYYALYFIYHNLTQDSLKADSLKKLIIRRYPNTLYGKKLRGVSEEKTQAEKVSHSRALYRKAEDLLDQKDYQKAIAIFRSIAQQDSGSIWAQKARFAVAYIYEKYLNDIDNAIKAYTLLVKEYPKSKFAAIARKKIAPPPPEPEEEQPTPETGEGQKSRAPQQNEKAAQSPETENEKNVAPVVKPEKAPARPIRNEENQH